MLRAKPEESEELQSEMLHIIKEHYDTALEYLSYHWGINHPLHMTIYDKIVQLLCKLKQIPKAFEYHRKSMDMAFKILGKSHKVSANYLTKAGYLYRALGDNDKAIEMYKEALQNSMAITDNLEAVAENNYCLADSLFVNGDVDQALNHALEAKRIRESNLGTGHPQSVESYYQVAQIAVSTYPDTERDEETTVVTSEVSRNFQLAISCYEKIFKQLKTKKDSNRQELMVLTRKIVHLKIKLMNNHQKDVLRGLRKASLPFTQDFVREVILRLVALTPTSYIDNILSRLESGDENALNEMGAILQIVESKSISLA
jgi:tetratricopeptide (TPR) repeat protein